MTLPTRTLAAFAPHRHADDAIGLLQADHDEIQRLFAEYERPHTAQQKRALVVAVCAALKVHTQIEEEMFFPDVEAELKARPWAADSGIARAGLRALIAQIEGGTGDDANNRILLEGLAEQAGRLVRQEQDDMFPRVRASSMDLLELGARMAARRAGLLALAG
ncbi:MAG: hemerythrin domain-containing protein [Vitreoscilla sp.]|nr:hemerythrin domain-containing protein [Vitreoscilla sp.]